jgi:IS5 family transposase
MPTTIATMKQLGLGLNLSTKKTRKRELLEEMERVVPWAALVQIVAPYYPKAKTGRPPFGIETMLRIHYMQQWFGLCDPAMEEALHDVPMYREFAKLDGMTARLPDETTILRFRYLLERHNLAVDMLRVVNDILQAKGMMMRTGTVVDATLISAPSSTKNAEGERDPEMKPTRKGQQLVLRHEGPHRRGRQVWPGAHGGRHRSQRQRLERRRRTAARR